MPSWLWGLFIQFEKRNSGNRLLKMFMLIFITSMVLMPTQPMQAEGADDYVQIFSEALLDVDYLNDQFIAVGGSGSIVTSPDGETWTMQTPVNTGYDYVLTGVEWNGAKYVAVGSNGTILTSEDAVRWSQGMQLGSWWLTDIEWTGSMFVVVGRDNSDAAGNTQIFPSIIYTSADGVNWAKRLETANTGLQVVKLLNGKLFTLGSNTQLYTSGNGIDWEESSYPIYDWIQDISWNGNKYIAVGNNGNAMASLDGVSWTTFHLSGHLGAMEWTGNEFIVAGHYGNIYRSGDGQNWSNYNLGQVGFYGVGYGNGKYVAVGGSDKSIFVSGDGASWSKKEITSVYPPTLYFNEAINIATIGHAGDVLVGDFNADGKSDLAASNPDYNQIIIMIGNEDGTFQAATNYAVGSSPFSITQSDFNGDENQDLAVTNIWSDNVSVLLGKGDGTFQPASEYSAGAKPAGIVAGDYNGDGKSDLAVANNWSQSISILIGNGDGTFQASINTYAAGDHPQGITTGDFNSDGNPDLAVTNVYSPFISVLLGKGDGTFQDAVAYTAGAHPNSVAVGDFNGDGDFDLAVTNEDSDNVSILLGNGDGTFQTAVNFNAGRGPLGIAIADFNSDEISDLAVSNYYGGNMSILLGNGDGTFKSADNYVDGFEHVAQLAVGDFNSDGKPDLALSRDNYVSVLINNNTAPTLSSIAITNQATKLVYTVGETLNIDGLVVEGIYSDGSTKTEIVLPENITGFNSSVPAIDQILTITIGGKATTYTVTINTALSTIAAVTSGSYTVSELTANTGTISNVPFGTTKAAFLSAVSKGEANQTWNATGLSDPVITGNTLVITAQDGIAIATYTVTVNAQNQPGFNINTILNNTLKLGDDFFDMSSDAMNDPQATILIASLLKDGINKNKAYFKFGGKWYAPFELTEEQFLNPAYALTDEQVNAIRGFNKWYKAGSEIIDLRPGTFTITPINQFSSGLTITANNVQGAAYFNVYKKSNQTLINAVPIAIGNSLNSMPAVFSSISDLEVWIYSDAAGTNKIVELKLEGNNDAGVLDYK